jgi:hypothetical protein
MKIVRNIQKNLKGNLICQLLIDNTWKDHIMKPNSEYKLDKSSEWNGIRKAVPAPAKTLDDIRSEREPLFKSHVDKYNPVWWAALTSAQKGKVSTYRKELMDITSQDPSDVTWPTPPS